jgi:prenyltransferase beta subunit
MAINGNLKATCRAIDTLITNQHPDGGFGGGPGQIPHLLPTYASVCALVIVGHPGEKGGWNQINRYVSLSLSNFAYIDRAH